jgi:hypothetical protein
MVIATRLLPLALGLLAPQEASEEDTSSEESTASMEATYYPIETIELSEDVALEVAGLLIEPDGRVLASTRRGEVWLIDPSPARQGKPAPCIRFAEGLQEPLGLLRVEDWIYTAQRGELTRFKDLDGDDRADLFETVCEAWEISGNYHEYAFGPRRDAAGDFWITLNKPFGEEPFGKAHWRGWAVRVTPEGKMVPTCSGLRSPAGLENSPWGEMFYTDNQGEWCGASKLSHLEPGDFHGHPWGLDSHEHPDCTLPHPGDPPDGELMPAVAKEMPLKLPAVWFPYDKMGKSPSGMAWDVSEGRFGPFAGQLFVGDQHHASVLRVFLERVNGHWQGACFPFRSGFQCGLIRVAFAADGSLFAGMSKRGWGSRGDSEDGLQRLYWSGEVPFEILTMEVQPGGFLLTFTHDLDLATALDPASYEMHSYTYKLHSEYGSPEVDEQNLSVVRVQRGNLDSQVSLQVEPLREGYVHELHLQGVQNQVGLPLLHDEAYYTLIHRPSGSGR